MPESATIEYIPFKKLRLDADNPRLPEGVLGKSEDDILGHLQAEAVLDELAKSFVDHGYFPSEPLTVMKDGRRDRYIVLEGNRRLAALRFLHGFEVPTDKPLLDVAPTPEQLERLEQIPCHVVKTRDEVDAMIGFRHIGGLKKWDSEAKARYIKIHIDELSHTEPDPFYALGRKVGSNSQGVRNPYIAISILHVARSSLGIDEANRLLAAGRFGVWTRALNSPDIKTYIGFGRSNSYKDVQEQLTQLNKKRLKEVIVHLAGEKGEQPIVKDSRDITVYGRILANESARDLLKKTRDIELAKQVINSEELPARIRKLRSSIQVLIDAVQSAEIGEEVVTEVRQLSKTCSALRAVVEDAAH